MVKHTFHKLRRVAANAYASLRSFDALRKSWDPLHFAFNSLKNWDRQALASYLDQVHVTPDEKTQTLILKEWVDQGLSLHAFSTKIKSCTTEELAHIPIEISRGDQLSDQNTRVEKHLQAYLANKRVVITGPADYVSTIQSIPPVDSYDVVVRVNFQWPISLLQQPALGARCDILYHCCNGAIDVARLMAEDLSGIRFVVLEQGLQSHRFARHCRALGIHVLYVSDLYHAWSRRLHSPPFTGFVAVTHLLSYAVKQLHVVGMNFGISSYDPTYLRTTEIDSKYSSIVPGLWLHDPKAHIHWIRRFAKTDSRLTFDSKSKQLMTLRELQP